MNVEGTWAPQWQHLVDVFAANFNDGEQCAGLAIYHRGELAVHLWSGEYTNRLEGIAQEPWRETTLVNIFSAGKGLVALCILQLVAQGKLSLDTPISAYWPEFAQGDKAGISVRDVLCHRSGLSAFHQHLADDQIFDWPAMTAAVASANAYHPESVTY